MAQIQCHDVEIEVHNCSADKLYDFFKNNMTLLPQMFPQIYKSVEVLEGDGMSVGTIRLWTYILGESGDQVMEVKETVKYVDDENRAITLSVLEGDIMNQFSSFESTLTFSPKVDVDGGCSVKWSLACGDKNEDTVSSSPDAYKDMVVILTQGVADYLQNLAI